ncbi:MAG TPA: hypothetical protein VGC82_18015 [Rhodopila sp.]|jgi:hypothetical protein
MPKAPVSGCPRRGHRQGLGSVKKILDSLTFANNPRAHFSRQYLPCTSELMKGLVHML